MTPVLRRAGISVPLFSLRSSRSWGIGEIGDIPAIAGWMRDAHHSVLQILPLNELAPSESSPYSPLSAMAIDPQFISIGLMSDGAMWEEALREELVQVRQTPRIDYAAVRSLKARAFRMAFDRFVSEEWAPDSTGAHALRSFVQAESWWLDEYSVYRALRAANDERPWTQWRPELRDRHPQALDDARSRLAREILFYQYLQWIAAGQWQSVRLGTKGVEIVGDMPFMVAPDSADVWSRQKDFMLDASVGTPPDAFSETGQEWGLPPYNWNEARANDFEWLRMRARRQANLYDGFRVDHLVGFYRTYVRPFNGAAPYFMPSEPAEQTALGEAVMRIMIGTGADVSVEDLGTVPDFVRASFASLGLPGYKVLRWEPGIPATYPARSVAMTGTHDTESLAEWWETLAPEERNRFWSQSPEFDNAVRDTILGHLYGSGSDLVLVPIQDVFGWRDRINRPATVGDQNWTYTLRWPIERMREEPDAIERASRLAEWSDETGRWNAEGQTSA